MPKCTTRPPNKHAKVAFVIDVRGEIEFDTLISELDGLKKRGYSCTTLFVDCDKNILINRYKETRRLHPLVPIKNLSINGAINLEKEMLAPIKSYADYVIDTTHLNVRQFREKLTTMLSGSNKKDIMITVMSFGFKYGIASESDLVFDVRCFPNPFYVEGMKERTGLEDDVREYVFSDGEAGRFLDKLYDMLDMMIPMYIKEGKSHLTISLGCTGGKHRSVAITEEVGKHLKEKYKTVIVHRDIEK